MLSARRWDAFAVQSLCNAARGYPRDIIGFESPENDGGLFLYDLQFPFLACDRAISIDLPAGISARADYAHHAALNLPRSFLALHLPNDAVHANLNGIHRTTVNALHFDVAEPQNLMDVREIGNIARDAICMLRDEHLEFIALRGDHQICKARSAEHRRSRFRAVGVLPNDLGSKPYCVVLAKIDLMRRPSRRRTNRTPPPRRSPAPSSARP